MLGACRGGSPDRTSTVGPPEARSFECSRAHGAAMLSVCRLGGTREPPLRIICLLGGPCRDTLQSSPAPKEVSGLDSADP